MGFGHFPERLDEIKPVARETKTKVDAKRALELAKEIRDEIPYPEYQDTEDAADMLEALVRENEELREELKVYKPCAAHGVGELPDSCWLCSVAETVKHGIHEREEVWKPLLAETEMGHADGCCGAGTGMCKFCNAIAKAREVAGE